MGYRSRSASRFETALAPAMRRLDGVRLHVGGDRTWAEVYGIGNRHPVTISIGLRLATELVEAGAPLTVCIEDPAPSDESVAAR